MNRKIIILSFITAFFAFNSAIAAFEYNGVFAAKRNSNEAQTYYILLNENTNVSFSLSINGKKTDEVFVSKIKLTSDESVGLTSKNPINNYKVTSTGIYEVSVTSTASLDKMISYDLSVDEVASNDSNNLKTPPSPTNVNIDSSNSSQELKNEQSSVTNSKES